MIYLERDNFIDVSCPECGQGFGVCTHDDQFYDGTYLVECLDCGTPLKIIVNTSTTFVCLYNTGV